MLYKFIWQPAILILVTSRGEVRMAALHDLQLGDLLQARGFSGVSGRVGARKLGRLQKKVYLLCSRMHLVHSQETLAGA
eukprot:scaffold79493_cov25-Tisochrysis_lutea.AAC.2